MKFLLWQFGAYAAMALVVGVVLGVVWERSTTRLVRRQLEHVTRLLAGAESAAARLRSERSSQQDDLVDAAQAERDIADLHAELGLARARAAADHLARQEAERRCEHAVQELNGLADARSSADGARAELAASIREVQALRDELDSVRRAKLDSETLNGRVRAREAALAAELAELRSRYQEAATASQTALSTATMDAAEARSRTAELVAEVARLRQELHEQTARRAAGGSSPQGQRHVAGQSLLDALDPLDALDRLEEVEAAEAEVIDLRSARGGIEAGARQRVESRRVLP